MGHLDHVPIANVHIQFIAGRCRSSEIIFGARLQMAEAFAQVHLPRLDAVRAGYRGFQATSDVLETTVDRMVGALLVAAVAVHIDEGFVAGIAVRRNPD